MTAGGGEGGARRRVARHELDGRRLCEEGQEAHEQPADRVEGEEEQRLLELCGPDRTERAEQVGAYVL